MTSPPIKRALKQLERAWKRVVFRALGALLPGQRTAAAPAWGARPHRVLYLRYDRIGDMIMATPLIRAIARSHPTIELDVLASPTNGVVLAGNPHVRRVLTFDESDSPRSCERRARCGGKGMTRSSTGWCSSRR